MERRRHGPRLHAEGNRDRLVIEVGVVAKEENEALSFGQRRHERFERFVFAVPVRRRYLLVAEGQHARRRSSLGCLPAPSLVHDDPEEPALDGTSAAEATPVPQRPYESLVNGFLAELLVAQDRDRYAQERAIAIAVDALDLTFFHHLNDPVWRVFL
jgi:hypothetical protein